MFHRIGFSTISCSIPMPRKFIMNFLIMNLGINVNWNKIVLSGKYSKKLIARGDVYSGPISILKRRQNMRIQDHVNHLIRSFLRNAPSQMFDRVLSTPLEHTDQIKSHIVECLSPLKTAIIAARKLFACWHGHISMLLGRK